MTGTESAQATLEAVKTAMALVRSDENEDWVGAMEEPDAIQIRDFGLSLLNSAHAWLDTEG